MIERPHQMLKILECLDRESPITNKKISELTGIPGGTVRYYTSTLNRSGLVKHHKDMRGVHEITQEGRDFLMKEVKKHG